MAQAKQTFSSITAGTKRLDRAKDICPLIKFMWILFLLFLIVFEAIADIFAKNYSLHAGVFYFLGAIVAYVVANVFWLFSLRSGAGLARGAIIFSVASAIVAVLLGLLLYRETVSARGITGILFGIVSLILILY